MTKATFSRSVVLLSLALLIGSLLPVFAGELVYPDVRTHLVELDSKRLRIGQALSVANFARVKPGLPFQELQVIFGPPFLLTRRDGVEDADYNIAFPVSGGTSKLICQFKVIVNLHGFISSTHWRRSLCQDLHEAALNEAAAVTVTSATPGPEIVQQAIEVSQLVPTEVFTISTAVAFEFAKAELTVQGRNELDIIATRLAGLSKQPLLVVIGHADRLGSKNANLVLSRRRAAAVRDYFIARGLYQELIHAEGLGDLDPVVKCDAAEPQALRKCLAPNRRVDIKTYERK